MITSLHRQRRERGVVLLICLIVLVILLAGGVAVMRSMNTTLSSAGNLAFKRDLVNQGEHAAVKALALFNTGGTLSAVGADYNDAQASNYSAVRLDSNDRGIPLALLKDDLYNAKASDTIERPADFVKIRYLIDRLCNTSGASSKSTCVYAPATTDVRGGSVQESGRPPPPKALVYRLSVRVDGPRDTQVFLQSSFTKPE